MSVLLGESFSDVALLQSNESEAPPWYRDGFTDLEFDTDKIWFRSRLTDVGGGEIIDAVWYEPLEIFGGTHTGFIILSDQLVVDLAEALTNWTQIGTFTTGPSTIDDYRLEGSLCLRGRLSANVRGWSHAVMPGADQVNQFDADVSSYVNITTAFNNATAGDVNPWPAAEAASDQMQIGWLVPFGGTQIIISTAGVGGTLTWKYWNGSTWVALVGVTDGTSGFTAAAGTYSVTWTVPTDWVKVSINNSIPLFYIAAEVTTIYSTNPILTQGLLMYAAGNDGYSVYLWINGAAPPSMDTWANGGIRLSVSAYNTADALPTLTGTFPNSGATNSRQWYVNGNDGFRVGGFIPYVFNPSVGGSLDLGSPIITRIRRVGLGLASVNAMAVGNFNFFWDACRIGTGLIIKNGVADGGIRFSDILAIDHAGSAMFGIITQVAGVFYLSGKLYIGQSSQDDLSYFNDVDQVIVFRNFPVSTDFYEIRVEGLVNKTSTFRLGRFTNNLASGGCVVKGAARTNLADPSPLTSVWTLTASNAFAVALLYSSTFYQMRRAFLNTAAEIRFCTFDTFGEIEANGALIQNCTFQNVSTSSPISGTWSLIVDAPSELTNVKNNSFINCNNAIKITTIGTYTFDNLKFSGNVFDVENSSAGLVTINVINGGDTPTVTNTGGGSTTINNTVTVTITVKDEAGIAIQNARVSVRKTSDNSEIISGLTNASGVVTGTFNFVSNTAVSVRVRKGSGPDPTKDYLPIDSPQTITGSGLTITITMVEDTINLN